MAKPIDCPSCHYTAWTYQDNGTKKCIVCGTVVDANTGERIHNVTPPNDSKYSKIIGAILIIAFFTYMFMMLLATVLEAQ